MEYEYLHFPAEAVHVDQAEFAKLPESAQRVFQAIRDHGPVTHAGLQGVTQIPARTIRFAVKRLKEEDFIDTRCSLRDCRTCYFFVAKRCVGIEALEQARHKADAHAADLGSLVEQT